MTPPVWVTEATERFWAAVRVRPPFPRDLAPAIASAAKSIPLFTASIPQLRLHSVLDYLLRLKIAVPLDEPDRPLRACLFCRYGSGFLFLDAADPPEEKRFSLAHELAHFLGDYRRIRDGAEKALGRGVLEVLDGQRAPTVDERLHAVLRNAEIGPHLHLMRRDDAGRPKSAEEREAELRADRLAFELLAPAELLQSETDRDALEARLVNEFGLPVTQAGEYAAILLPDSPDSGSLVERLRKSC